MSEQIPQGRTAALMHEMGLNEATLERRKKLVALEPEDLPRVAAIRKMVASQAEGFADAFFQHLSSLEEARPLMASKAILERARQLKREHIVAMVSGDYGMNYVAQRLELALLYAAAGLETRVFVGAFHQLLRTIGAHVMEQSKRSPQKAFESFMSFEKVAFLDLGLIVEVLVFERERLIRQQQEAIRELSTPVLQVRGRMLLLPIIGVIDTHRARLITESLLKAIRANRAKVVVMDVTGVATIDSKVANHILQTVTAAGLMGAKIIVTGLSSDVAQSLAALGIELSKITTVGDLQGGLEEAEQILGYRVVQAGSVVAPASAVT